MGSGNELMKCGVHDVLMEELREIKLELKEIRKMLLGNGGEGIDFRLRRLEYERMGVVRIIGMVFGVIQAFIVSWLVYVVLGGR